MSLRPASRVMAAIAVAGALALVLAGCTGTTAPAVSSATSASTAAPAPGSTPAGGQGGTGGSPTARADGTSGAVRADQNTWCATINRDWPGIAGTNVTIESGLDKDAAAGLRTSWADFTACTGATITLTSDEGFDQQILADARTDNLPDLAIVDRPELLGTLADVGAAVAAPQQVAENVDRYWNPQWKQYGTVNGTFYAAPLSATVKSLVWYSPAMFKAKGYRVPQTWDQMIALSEAITDSGDVKPWCAGIAAGDATGWPVADWLEEVVLRSAGPQVYDRWAAGNVAFTDPTIASALAQVGQILKNPRYVNAGQGDVASIATTDVDQAGVPILSGTCYLMQMGNSYRWPAGTTIGPQGDVYAFYEPVMTNSFGKPVEVGGDFLTAFNARPAVQAVQYYLSTARWANNQSMSSPTRISANKGLKLANVRGPVNKLAVQILQDPKAVTRFDASGLMPAAVGSGAEWTQLTAWISGQDDATTLQAIQQAWPVTSPTG